MYEISPNVVLRCDQCNKPFDKEATLKRHGYYCRSRKGNRARVRSCLSCTKLKARCDKLPKCSRCRSKGIDCQYPATAAQARPPRTQGQDGELPQVEMGDSEISTPLEIPINFDDIQEEITQSDMIITEQSSLAIASANRETDQLEWIDSSIDLSEFLNSPIECSQCPYSTIQRTPSLDPAIFSASNLTIPMTPRTDVRSLVKRPERPASQHRVACLIYKSLMYYPKMLMRDDNTFPPYIHPSFFKPEDSHDNMEPLNNCINLVRMLSGGVRGSRKLFWRNVRSECEHVYAKLSSLNKWQLLSAMQALTIYVFIRIDEGESEHNNLDYLLLATVIALANQARNHIILETSCDPNFDNGVEAAWESWVFDEAIRRTCLVYQIVDMLIYFEPAGLCDAHDSLVLAPLPSRKHLWEANDASSWNHEFDKVPNAAFGLASNGDLVKIYESQVYDIGGSYSANYGKASSMATSDWGEWCQGMDSLGGLVMLAASLVG